MSGLILEGSPAPPIPEDLNNCAAIVTGGLGGLGVVSGLALVEAGVKHVILCGRSGKVRPGQGLDQKIKAMPDSDSIVEVVKCDASKEIDAKERGIVPNWDDKRISGTISSIVQRRFTGFLGGKSRSVEKKFPGFLGEKTSRSAD